MKEKTKVIQIRLTESNHAYIKKQALLEDRSIAYIINRIIREKNH